MKKVFTFLMCFLFGAIAIFAQKTTQEQKEYASPNSPIDNMGHWSDMAERGVVQLNPTIPVKPAVEGTSMINSAVLIQDSPDVVVLNVTNVTQSENSVFIDPNDKDYALVSNNSEESGSIYGSNYVTSDDGGLNWSGSKYGAGGTDKGDPAACIGLNGRHYIGSISSARKQVVSWSDNGTSWTKVNVESGSLSYPNLFDKNHLWIDNTNSSQEGNVYDAWIRFESGHANNRNIEFSRSTNDGISWSTPINISSGVSAGYMDQGVNIQCNTTGWVFAVWAIHDEWVSGSYEEDAIGFARSPNGGASFYGANRIVNNIKGIRSSSTTSNPTGKAMRTNSFPSMAIDNSGGINHGHIYVVWANNGVPGTNTGTNVSIYLTKSTNGGTVWSTPTRINASAASDKAAFFPWITCDPVTGNLFVVYYDDLNQTTTSTAVETFVAYSDDDGISWTDMVVSDVAFTPSAIPGLAGGYFGDYLGIAARDGKVYPTWTDNRSGRALTYVSPLDFGGGCIASGGCDEYIARVEFADIDNSSACENYSDFRDISTDLGLNETQTITVTNGVTSYPTDQCGIWVDWNKDGDFTDANEEITVVGTPGVGPYTASISPPGTASLGECTMRVRITYSGAVDPCGETSFGEVEDYTINLTPKVPNEWTGAFNGYWHNNNNWSLGHIPTFDEHVIITSAGIQPPAIDFYDEACNNLTIETGAGLRFYDQALTVNGSISISGELEMLDDDAELTVLGGVFWNSGSTANITHSAFIRVYGDWNFSSGANANFDNGFVDFVGTGSNWIRSYSTNCSFYNIWIHKTGGALVRVSNLSSQDLVVNNLTFIYPGAIYYSLSDHDLVMKGSFNYYGTFDFTQSTNAGAVVFDGTSQSINNYSSGSGLFNNVVFSSSSTASLSNSGITIMGDVTIESGTFNSNGLGVEVHGSWTRTGGTYSANGSTVTFDGGGVHQDVNGTNTFYNIIQLNTGSFLRFNDPTVISNDLELNYRCWAYSSMTINGTLIVDDAVSRFGVYSGTSIIASVDQGGEIAVSNGTLTVDDLVENGIEGTYHLISGEINLSQNGGGFMDLNGNITIEDGVMNLYDTGYSYWPYTQDASITMNGGVLDMHTLGIQIHDNHTLTSNINSGVIRTASGFNGNRNDFQPTTGLFEFYGTSNANISQTNGCTLYNVNIDKETTKGSILEDYPIIADERNEMQDFMDEEKANLISLTTDFNITGNLTLASGSLLLNGHELTVLGSSYFYGALNMTNAADVYNAGIGLGDQFWFYTGSTANLTAGNIYLAWGTVVENGVSFTATTANTLHYTSSVYRGGIANGDPNTVFGNINVNKPIGYFQIWNDGFEPIVVDGDFSLAASNQFEMQDLTMIVHGNFTDQALSETYLYNAFSKSKDGNSGSGSEKGSEAKIDKEEDSKGAKGGYLEIDTDFTLNGLLDIDDGDVLVHGIFGTASTGSVVINGGTFVADAPLHAKGWEFLNGNLSMTSGLFEITYNSPNFSSTATSTISGGIVRTGEAFSASFPGNFEPSGGIVEINGIGSNTVFCDDGNYFYNLLINKNTGASAHLFTDITVINDLTINSGTFVTTNFNINVGGDWTNNVGNIAFDEGTGTVTFNGANDVGIYPGETFYHLALDKASSGDWLTLSDDVTALGNLDVKGGALHTAANTLDVYGDVTIDGGTLFVQAGGTLKVGDNKTLTTASGSNFFIEGSSSNYATLTHSGTGRYNCNIYGEIAANYAVFEYTSANGVFVQAGATVNPVYTFNHCIFQNGAPAKGSAYLVLHGSNTFNAIDTYFDNAGGNVGNNVWKSVSTGNVTFQAATGDFAGPEFEYDVDNRIHWTDIDVEVGLELMLEGPYNGSGMNTDLYSQGLIPTNQPFDSDPAASWYYTGSESVGSIPANVVDWVYVQIRDASDAASAVIATIVAEQAAFVLSDGSVVNLNGSSNLDFPGINYSNGLFPVVWHRNHLGIISSNKMTRVGGVYTYDFTQAGAAYTNSNLGQTNLGGGVWGMWGGDSNGSGWVYDGDTYWDWNPNAGTTGYMPADYNLDSQLDNKDKNDIWFDSYNKYSQIPSSKSSYNKDYK